MHELRLEPLKSASSVPPNHPHVTHPMLIHASSEWASNPNRATLPPPGFGGLSRRHGKKPIIAAINGLCIGGGFEMAVNADLIIASASAKFQLPEAQVGVAVLAGALPRLARTVGKQRVTELAITGRTLSAREAREWGLVNEVVERDTDLMPRAVEMAKRVVRCSPDSVIISREGIARGWEGSVVEGDAVTERLWSAVEGTANHEEGLRAWGKRKLPKWEPSKL